MKRTFFLLLFFVLSVTGSTVKAAQFQATGYDNPDIQPPPGEFKEAVKVTFDMLPTSIDFLLPAYPSLTQEGIHLTGAYVETYDPARTPDDVALWQLSFEVAMDVSNKYSRMWYESQSPARVTVRWRAPLVSHESFPERFAHAECGQVMDLGDGKSYPGDWVQEWYYIYPDGYHIRKVKIYTCHANALGEIVRPGYGPAKPPVYAYETNEFTSIVGRGETKSFNGRTVVQMYGQKSKDAVLDTGNRDGKKYIDAFNNGEILVFHSNSGYHPFFMQRFERCGPVAFDKPRRDKEPIELRGETIVGHMHNYEWFERTDTSLTDVFLQGWANCDKPEDELVPLAKAWWNPPEVILSSNSKFNYFGFDVTQRAFVFDAKNVKSLKSLEFTLEAGKDSPVVNPVFLINNWGTENPVLQINDKQIPQDEIFRVGFYDTFDNDDDIEYKNAVILWLDYKSTHPMKISIQLEGSNQATSVQKRS